MFQCVTKQGVLLKKLFESFKEFVNEFSIFCSPKGLNIQAMDASHIMLIHCFLTTDFFETYNCSSSLMLGLNVQALSKILKCVGPEDNIQLSVSNNDLLNIEIVNKDRESNFTLRLLDLDMDLMEMASFQYQGTITINTDLFQRTIRDISQLTSKEVTLECNVTNLCFTSIADEGSSSIRFNNENKGLKCSLTSSYKETFSLKYLNQISKHQLSSTLILHVSEGLPLKLEWLLINTSYVHFYLAPKIEDDDQPHIYTE